LHQEALNIGESEHEVLVPELASLRAAFKLHAKYKKKIGIEFVKPFSEKLFERLICHVHLQACNLIRVSVMAHVGAIRIAHANAAPPGHIYARATAISSSVLLHFRD
jgi:hypothetical protein